MIAQDVRYGFRQLYRSPGFAAAVILTLALGIGANTAIFSVVEAVLLRPLPYRDASRLVKIVAGSPGVGLKDVATSPVELQDLRALTGVFDDVSVVWPVSVNLTGAKEPARLELLGVSPNYFSMLGAAPQIGRLFGSQDVAEGFAEAVVISDGLWRRSYGADPFVLGRRVRLDNDIYTIVGVLPRGFRHPGKTVAGDVDVWAAAGFTANPFPKPARNARFLPGLIGRLSPSTDLDAAQARLAALSARLRQDFPNDYPAQGRFTVEVQPLQESLVGDIRPMLLVLMGAVTLIILVASVNIANLLLARASGREREIAVRLALGATPGRIVSQLVTEAMLLSLVAGAVGLSAAGAGMALVVRLLPPQVARLADASVDVQVVAFALGISLLTGAAFGLAPALQASRGDLVRGIREGSWGSGHGARTNRLRAALIVTELALAVVLMVGAGLLVRTFWSLAREYPGFNPAGVVTAGVWLPVPNDPNADLYAAPEARNHFVRESLRRVSALPGIEQAAITSALPATGQTFSVALAVEKRPVESSADLRAELIAVSPEYLNVMRTALVRGRFFTEADDANKPAVALIDESSARRFWDTADPVGERVRFGQNPNAPWITVVGVVGDVKHDGLETGGVPHLYRPVYQVGVRAVNFVLRTALPAAALEPLIRREVQSVDPTLPIFKVQTMDDVMSGSLAPRRLSAQMIGAFAALSLLLASIGIYGLLAYMVGQRSREIGVRMALGARPVDILTLILRSGALLAGTGVALGLVFSAIAAPALASQLYGVRPIDPAVFLVVPLVLFGVAIAASFIPARRASRVDPIIVLHEG
ncbi:MAG: ABC transporter permease [Acidobacteria bacterium]|nr:ABC transporter permease [Acidobacteriota bacterium]